jgi:hypothetical protein
MSTYTSTCSTKSRAVSVGAVECPVYAKRGDGSYKSRRRQIYNHGRRSDLWGTFFILAVSEHLTSKIKKPHYELCGKILAALRGGAGKAASAKVRVHKFKKAYPWWPQILQDALHDYDPPPPKEVEPPDTYEEVIDLLKRAVQCGLFSAAALTRAIEEDKLSEFIESVIKKNQDS